MELPWAAWYEDGRHQLRLPDGVQVSLLAPAGGPALSAEEIASALERPVGTPTLRELARGAGSACIAVDDLTRPTRVADVLPLLLAMLTEAGIYKENICFVVATGSHAALKRDEIRLKFGEEISRRYSIESHNCRDGLTGTGIPYGDNELKINARFLAADVRVVVGSVLPHSFAGFSGGAKLVLPGLSDLNSLRRSHKMVQLGRKVSSDPNQNTFRLEAEELVRQIGVHQAVCVVSDVNRRTIGVTAGDVVEAHRKASATAQQAFRTPLEQTYDAVVLNAYPKDADLIQASNAFIPLKGIKSSMLRPGGLFLLCSAAYKGMGEHGVFAPTGGGRPPAPLRHLGERDLWIYAPGMPAGEVRQLYWEGYRAFSEAPALTAALGERLSAGSRVAVLPCAPMQQLHDNRNFNP